MTDTAAPSLVVGIGNPMRRDDGAGWAVASAVAADPRCEQPGAPIVVSHSDGEPARLVELWRPDLAVVVVDALRADLEPGTVVTDPTFWSEEAPVSTHGGGLATAVELARALDRLPERLSFVGVVGSDFGNGPGLSDPVASAVDRAAATVFSLLAGRPTSAP